MWWTENGEWDFYKMLEQMLMGYENKEHNKIHVDIWLS